MERRKFLVGATVATAIAVTSSKANSAEISVIDSDINLFIRENPELENSVMELLRKGEISQVRDSIKAFRDFSKKMDAHPATFYDYGLVLPQWRKCIDVPKSAVVAVGWYYKVAGGALNLASIPIASTVAGVPIAIVLAALGIGSGWGGDAILSWADKQKWPKRICVDVK